MTPVPFLRCSADSNMSFSGNFNADSGSVNVQQSQNIQAQSSQLFVRDLSFVGGSFSGASGSFSGSFSGGNFLTPTEEADEQPQRLDAPPSSGPPRRKRSVFEVFKNAEAALRSAADAVKGPEKRSV